MKKNKIKNQYLTPKKMIILTFLVFLIVGLTMIFLSYKNLLMSFDILINSILKNPGGIFPIIIVFSLFILGGSFSFYILASFFNKKYKFKDSIVVFCIGSFISNITPFATGGQIIQLFLLNNQGLSKRESFTVLLVQFMIYQLTMTLITSAAFIFNLETITNLDISWVFSVGLIGILINLSITLFLFVATYSKKIYSIFIKIINRIIILIGKKHYVKNINKKMIKIKEGFIENTSLINGRIKILSLAFLGCFVWIFSWIFLSYLSLQFIKYKDITMNIPFQESFTLTSLVLSTNAFVPIPGAAGTTEILYILSFGKVISNLGGIDIELAKSIATSSSIVWRVWVFYLPIFLGIICLLYSKNGLRKYLAKTKE